MVFREQQIFGCGWKTGLEWEELGNKAKMVGKKFMKGLVCYAGEFRRFLEEMESH